MKIAICDDSREDRGALRALLEARGHDFEIKEYGSGAELYADMGYVRECGIVFLDINLCFCGYLDLLQGGRGGSERQRSCREK